MNTLVSILIPVFNREHLVGESIESALNQTYRNIEVIVVDNCSTDNTWQVLQQYASSDDRIRLFRNKENIGPVLNWKRCVNEAKGEYVKILFSDDLISSNYIEENLKLFNRDVAFVLSGIQLFGKEKKDRLSNYEHKKLFSSDEYLTMALLFNTFRFPVSPGAALFRSIDVKRSLEVDIPNPWGLDFKKFGAGNDLLIFLYTATRYPMIRISEDTTAWFRFHNDSFTASNRLSLYYDYAKLHFIQKNRRDLLPRFKAVVWSKKMQNLSDSKIYHAIDSPGDWGYLFIHMVKKRWSKFKSRIKVQ